MILVRRIGLTTLLLLTLFSILFIGIKGYTVTGNAMFSDFERKFHAENLLYLALIASILVILSYGAIVGRSYSLIKEIDKIIELTQLGNTTVEESLKRIGIIGKKIFRIYENLNELNVKMTLKISSLSGINTFLLNNIDLSLLIADAGGRITEVSRKYRERDQADERGATGKHIAEIFPDVAFEEIANNLETQRVFHQNTGGQALSFLPVFNREDNLSHVICVIGKEQINTGTPSQEAPIKAKRRPLSKFIMKFAPRIKNR